MVSNREDEIVRTPNHALERTVSAARQGWIKNYEL
jgi:hypothetical protein